MQIRRTVLDAPKGKRLDWPIAWLVLDEAFELQIVHLVIHKEWATMTTRALCFTEKELFTSQFSLGCPPAGL